MMRSWIFEEGREEGRKEGRKEGKAEGLKKRLELLVHLFERRLGPVRVFVNVENLADIRQTKYDPLVLPVPLPDGRRTVDAWAPLDGRVWTSGVRFSF